MERRLSSPVAAHKTAGQPSRSIGWSRRFVLTAATVLIVAMAGTTLLFSSQLPTQIIFGAAVGDISKISVALLIGIGLGSLGSYVWLRGRQRG